MRDSGRWNTENLIRLLETSTVISGMGVSEIPRDAAREDRGGHGTGDHGNNTTRRGGKASASTDPREGISDGKCLYGATTSDRNNMITLSLPFLAAKTSRKRRFHVLYDRIFRPDILLRYWMEMRRDDGSALIDGLTIGSVEHRREDGLLASIET